MRLMLPARRRGEHGQALVLIALWLTLLLGFAALAIDVGRFYSERRFLQNAADAAALAGARALHSGRSVAQAEAAARAVLTQNFANEPTGNPPSLPSNVPIYAEGHAGEGGYLLDGILIGTTDVRVAIRNPVNYTFGRVLNLVTQEIGAQARAGFGRGLLPIAARRYVKAPGPNPGVTSTTICSDDEKQFLDFFATQNTACRGSEGDPTGRAAPSAGLPFDASDPSSDPVNHGPVFAILGQGAQSANAADFRGFVALDLRNFATGSASEGYNGVSPTTNANSLKDFEADWIRQGGYPGPDLPPITSPPNPGDQVATISGNNSAPAIVAMNKTYDPGDEILVCVYPGTMLTLKEFAISPPPTISLAERATVTGTVASMAVSRNQAFSGTVALATLRDSGDSQNPMTSGRLTSNPPFTYSPNPVTPSLGVGTRVDMRNVTTNNAVPGIYTLWVQGDPADPAVPTKVEPFTVKIGSVTRDFSLTSNVTTREVENAGRTVDFRLRIQNSPKTVNFGRSVTLSVDDTPENPRPAGMGAVNFSASSVTPDKNGVQVVLTVNTGSMAAGLHRFAVRATAAATGTTAETRKVTHVIPLYIHVSPPSASASKDYVDIIGFAAMRIASIDSSSVEAYAISPVVSNLNDPRLSRGYKPRLLPW